MNDMIHDPTAQAMALETRVRSILSRLYFYAPDYWTGATDDAGTKEYHQRLQEDFDKIAAALTQARREGREEERERCATFLEMAYPLLESSGQFETSMTRTVANAMRQRTRSSTTW